MLCMYDVVTMMSQTYAQVVQGVETVKVEVKNNQVNWFHVPTKAECKTLLDGKFFWVAASEIEKPCEYALDRLKDPMLVFPEYVEGAIKEMKTNYPSLKTPHCSFYFADNRENDTRAAKDEIYNAVNECYMDFTQDKEVKLWNRLIEKLTDEQWNDLWMQMDFVNVMYANWFLHLLNLERSTVIEAGYLSSIWSRFF